MKFTETKLKGAYIIDIDRIEDERGFFGRSYDKAEFAKYGLATEVMQSNVSYNEKKATLRGMHTQVTPFEETKLVRCTRGSIYDVIVDMREDSDTYLQWIGVELTASSYRMLFVPGGFAHGFITLEDLTEVIYQVSQNYTPAAERCFRWNDPAFNIQWPLQPEVISDKDNAHQLLSLSNPII